MGKPKRTRVESRARAIALYHVVYEHEGFEDAAQSLFKLVREAQARFPNQRRALFLDIEGHRNEQGAFDADMFELQKDFLIGFLGQFLSEIHCPLATLHDRNAQNNGVPGDLEIRAPAEQRPQADT